MEIFCTRPNCHHPKNHIDGWESLQQSSPPQRYCVTCGMNLVLSERYVPLQLLGSGAFGVTFLARDLRTLERKCIVKQLRPQNVLKPEQLSAVENLFRRESMTLEQLGDVSTQIPTLFDSFVLPLPGNPPQEIFYLVQQYIDGQDLALELKQKGAFSQGEILDLLYQILPVLELVHENGVIHRDVKPANIMRAKNGLMYLIDFGAVKQIMSGVSNTQSIVIGTEGYAPLEQMSGRAVYPSTDLYALAISCITLMGNMKPSDPNFLEFIDNWRSPLVQAKLSQIAVEPALADILEKMIRSQPRDRYQSVTEVFDALQAAQLFPPITQRPRLSSGGSQPITSAEDFSNVSAPSAPVTALSNPAEQVQPHKTPSTPSVNILGVIRRSFSTVSAPLKKQHLLLGSALLGTCAIGLAALLFLNNAHLFKDSVLTGEELAKRISIRHILTEHQNSVTKVSISADSKLLASSSHDKTVKLWNLTDGKLLRTMTGHKGGVLSVAINPKGKTLVSGSTDNQVKVWDLESGKQLQDLGKEASGGWVTDLAITPDGQEILSARTNNRIDRWNLQTNALSNPFQTDGDKDKNSPILAVVLSNNGQLVASGSSDNKARLWFSSGKFLHQLKGHQGWVTAVAITPDNRYLATGSIDNTIKLWDVNNGSEVKTFRAHAYSVSAIAISPDGLVLASGGFDGEIRLWNMQTAQNIRTFSGAHEKVVTALAFSPDGQTLVSSSSDNTVKIWRAD
jgi:WD40 repeat protein/tRNA A-37 threonylcarbamoyl transferase component Bud32